MVLAQQFAAHVNTHDGGSILCSLVLIGAIIATVLVLLALIGVGPWHRTAGAAYGPNHYGPVVAAVVLWVVYFIFCS